MALTCKLGETKDTIRPGAIHHLKATPETVHWGYFSPDIKPALTIRSGDLVFAEAITHHAGDALDLMFDAGVERIFTEIDPTTRAPGVHIMTGPIFVEGAEPGDMLEVRYLSMVPRNNYGSNLAANWGHLYQEFGEKERVTIYELDPVTQTAHALYAYDFPGKYLVRERSPIARSATVRPLLKGSPSPRARILAPQA
jgi:acetamidase/formamidase